MAKYAIVRTDNMSGTVNGKDLVSLNFADAIENGNVVLIGGYADGEREVRTATVPAADSNLSDIALVASEEVVNSKNYNGLSDFINEKGDIIRGYRLTSKDIFSVSKEALDGDAEVGHVVELQAKTKLKVVASATASTTTVGKVIAIEGEWIVIEVA